MKEKQIAIFAGAILIFLAGCSLINAPESHGVQFGIYIQYSDDTLAAELGKADGLLRVGVNLMDVSRYAHPDSLKTHDEEFEHVNQNFFESRDRYSWERRKIALSNHFEVVTAKEHTFGISDYIELFVPGVVGLNWIELVFMDGDSITQIGAMFPLGVEERVTVDTLYLYPYYGEMPYEYFPQYIP